ncbi:MAG: S8 family serine peptidase [Defluviitaleaceae bacterium]|nr:S8 family serine peptidase [Defluviitaleaceae bacterium]
MGTQKRSNKIREPKINIVLSFIMSFIIFSSSLIIPLNVFGDDYPYHTTQGNVAHSQGNLIGFEGSHALLNDDSLVDVIVMFNTEPVAVQRVRLESIGIAPLSEDMSRRLVEDSHALFKRELDNLFATRTRSGETLFEISNEFRIALNGISLTLPSNMVQAVANFSSVAVVLPDFEIYYEMPPEPIQQPNNPQITINPFSAPLPSGIRGPHGVAPGRHFMRVNEVHDMGYRGAGVVIAVKDSGIYYRHPAFAGSFLTIAEMQARGVSVTNADGIDINGNGTHYFLGRNFFAGRLNEHPVNYPREATSSMIGPRGTIHGTNVSGIIISRDTGADVSLLGIAPEAKAFHYRMLQPTQNFAQPTPTVISNMIAQYEQLVHDKADVINMSFGTTGHTMVNALSSIIVNNIMLHNPYMVFVSSAGNSGPNFYQLTAPATSSMAITAANIQVSDIIASLNNYNVGLRTPQEWEVFNSSSRGPSGVSFEINPHLGAPGYAELTTTTSADASSSPRPGEMIRWVNGSSISAPHITGAAALLIEYSRANGGQWTAEEIKVRMMNNAIPVQRSPSVFASGAGFVDVYAAIRANTVVSVYYDRVVFGTPTNFPVGLPFEPQNFTTSRTGSFSFGQVGNATTPLSLLSNAEQPSNVRTLHASIENQSTQGRTYTIRYDFTRGHANVNLTLSRREVFVPAGQTANFAATMSIRGTVPGASNNSNLNQFYEGFIIVECDLGETHITLPFALVNRANVNNFPASLVSFDLGGTSTNPTNPVSIDPINVNHGVLLEDFIENHHKAFSFRYGGLPSARPERVGYTFLGWYLDSSFTNPLQATTTMTSGNITLYARWEEGVTITPNDIIVTTTGDGTVTSSAITATEGTQIELTATPNSNYEFYRWEVMSGGAILSAQYNPIATFTMPNNYVEIRAIFREIPVTPIPHTILINTFANGTASADYTSAVEGTYVTITATPGIGYEFERWEVFYGSVALSSDTNPIATFTMPNSDVTIMARFSAITVTPPPPVYYDVVVNYTSGGTASANYATAQTDTVIDLTAYADPGYEFYTWEVIAGGVTVTSLINPITTFTMPNNDVTIMARFRAITVTPPPPVYYDVVVNHTGGGTASANYATAQTDTVIDLTAYADPGYEFYTWEVIAGGVTVTSLTNPITTFTMPNNDVTIMARFRAITVTPPPPVYYDIVVNYTSGGTASANYTTAQTDTVIDLTAYADPGYEFYTWEVIAGGVTVTSLTNPITTFTMPNNDVTIMARFRAITPYFEVIVHRGGLGANASPNSAEEGQTITINAGTRAGYTFAGWTSNNTYVTFANDNSRITTFDLPASDVIVTANWRRNVTPPNPPITPPNPPIAPPNPPVSPPISPDYSPSSSDSPSSPPVSTTRPQPQTTQPSQDQGFISGSGRANNITGSTAGIPATIVNDDSVVILKPTASLIKSLIESAISVSEEQDNPKLTLNFHILEVVQARTLLFNTQILNLLIEEEMDLVLEFYTTTVILSHESLVILSGYYNTNDTIAIQLNQTLNDEFNSEDIRTRDLLEISVDIIIAGEIIEVSTINLTLEISLKSFDLSRINTYRITATLLEDQRLLGSKLDTETNLFTIEVQNSNGIIVSYIENLIRLITHLGSVEIFDLADNMPIQIMDVPSMIFSSRTLLPIRFAAYALGANIDWIPATENTPLRVTLDLEDQTLTFGIGEMVYGMDVPSQIIDGRTMVPLRFISEFFGAIVNWNEDTTAIEIIRQMN